MKKLNLKTALVGASALVALSALTATIALAGDGDDAETTIALPAPAFVTAINAAVAVKPGNIKSVESEVEAGVNQIEVELVADADGKAYEVTVDATSGKILDVKADMSDVPVMEVPPPATAPQVPMEQPDAPMN